jgi:hypothetical protein
MIFMEQTEGYCLSCMNKKEITKVSIITPFHRDDREFELCDDCAGMLSEMLRDKED